MVLGQFDSGRGNKPEIKNTKRGGIDHFFLQNKISTSVSKFIGLLANKI